MEKVAGDPGWLDAHAALLKVHYLKSSGYGTDADPLANFTAIAEMTGEPPWRYPIRRMLEKLARCVSLDKQGRQEELEEEFTDIASLALCATSLRRRSAQQGGVLHVLGKGSEDPAIGTDDLPELVDRDEKLLLPRKHYDPYPND